MLQVQITSSANFVKTVLIFSKNKTTHTDSESISHFPAHASKFFCIPPTVTLYFDQYIPKSLGGQREREKENTEDD
jgi:hypothetical protein